MARPDILGVLRRHAGIPDSALWAELGIKVDEARAIVAHIDGLTKRIAELTVSRPARAREAESGRVGTD